MKRATTCLVALLTSIVSSPAVAQVEISSNAISIELTGRLHFQGITSSCAGFPIEFDSACSVEAPAFDMFLRRVRFAAEITYNDWIIGKVEPDYGEVDGVTLADAYGQLLFSEAASLKFGHFKKPFDGFQLISTTQLLVIERDIDIPGMSGPDAASYDEFTTAFRLADRDIGIEFGGARGRFAYWLGMFNGGSSTDNNDSNTEVQFIGRGQWSFGVGRLPARVAVAFAATDRSFVNDLGGLDGKYFPAVELWAEVGSYEKKLGPHLQAGIVFGENPLQNTSGAEPDLETDQLANMMTWQVIAAYMIPAHAGRFLEAVQPFVRITMAEPNTDVGDDIAWGFTPGVHVYFDGRNKVAANLDLAVFQDDALRSESSFKFQYYFHF